MARAARRSGRRVAAIAFPRLTDPDLEKSAAVTWLAPGQVGAALDALRQAGVREAAMAGKVPKAGLYRDPTALRPDAEAMALLASLRDRQDDSILGALADLLEERGVRLLPQAELVPELVAGEGPLGRTAPTAAQQEDIAFGVPLAKAVAGLDAAIRRAGEVAPGACVVKVAKPRQDPRFDVPVVGPDTLAAMLDAKASVLAFEAGGTLVLERESLVARADADGVALVGVAVAAGS
jgi:DUF1009 family protein